MTATTTTHDMNTVVLMRSHTPAHGVGRFACIAGAYVPVHTPEANTTAIVTTE